MCWWFSSIALLGTMLTVGACTYLNVHRIETSAPPASFPGVASLLADPDLSLVSVLLVHGFGRHEAAYSDPLRERLRQATGLTATGDGGCRDHAIGTMYGSIRICEYEGAASSRPLRLRVYALLWSPLSQPFKDRYLARDRDAPDRLMLDRWIKNSFVNDRFADAVLYLGDLKREMQKPIEYALCFMLNEPLTRRAVRNPIETTTACEAALGPEERVPPRDRAFVIITESLGSTMTWETLVRMHEERHSGQERARTLGRVAREVLGLTRVVFMLANQLPLLHLATMSRPISPAEVSDRSAPLATLPEGVGPMLLETMRNRPGATPRIEVVAVSDPNDLLGYALPPDVGQGLDDVLRATNVVHSVAKWGYLFVAAHPLKAHTRYLDDDAILELLVCGEPSSCPKIGPS